MKRTKKEAVEEYVKTTLSKLSYIQLETTEPEQYSKFSLNGKRFIYINNKYDPYALYICIREDGDTRTVFSGIVYTLEQFSTINHLTKQINQL